MHLDSLKFWHRRKKDAKSSTSLPATTSTGLPPSNTATAHQTTTCIASGVSNDEKDDSAANISPHLQATSASQYSGSVSQTSECPPPVNPLVITQPSPTLSKPSNCSTGKLQERLWNQAYAGLEADEHKTIEAYENFLLERSKDLEPRHMSSPADETTASTLRNPDRMAKMVQTGLEKSERVARAKKNIEEFGRVAAPVKAVMNIVVQAAPQAAIAWSCISFSLEMLANPLTESSINRDGITYVLGMMEWYWELVGLLLDEIFPSPSLRDQVEKQIVQLYQKLLLFQMKSICRYFRNQIYVVVRDVVKWDDWAGELKGVQDAEDDLRKRLDGYKDASIIHRLDSIDTTLKRQFGYISGLLEAQQKRDEDNDNRRWVAALRQTNPIDDKSRIQREKGELLRDSYRWVLDDDSYKAWEKDSACHLLWIYGDPGKGKTMLLCGIIDELEKDPSNTLSYFFCQASEATLNNATSILRGLVYSLVYRYPQLVPHIRSARPAIGSEQFVDHNAWETLSDILNHALRHDHLHGAVLLLDALDECVDIDDRRKLVEFFRRVSSTHHVKFIITSREWQSIRKEIGDKTDGTFIISLEENKHFVSTAVTAYIDREVQSLASVDPYKRLPKVLTTVKSHLLQNAQDTFLWVALVCKALKHSDIEEEDHVNEVLNQSPPGLEALYKRMLSQISSSKFYSDLCIKILEVMSVLKRAITLPELYFILDALPGIKVTLDSLRRAIQYCGSMLNIQENTIHFVHQSAVDFLNDPTLEGVRKTPERHRHVSNGCLRGLRASIKRDIYGLNAPDIHRDDIKAPESDPLAPLRYACVYWVDHLGDGDFPNHVKDNSDAHQFLKEKFLYWIEAMSLLHEMPQAIQAIQRLQTLVERTQSSVEQGLSGFLNDANRFLLFYRTTIENTPLQLYASCLVFSPEQSIVKAYFQDEAPKWVTVKPGLEPTWPSCLQTLQDHQGGVLCVVYSHDGQWLVSGSCDGEVKLWHAGTGTCIRTVGGHGQAFDAYNHITSAANVLSVAFSADDKSFISGSSNGVVKIWDRMTGSCIRKRQTHSSNATAMAISSDGCTAVSALPDGNIIIAKTNEDVPSRIVNCHESGWGLEYGYMVDLTANGQWAVVTVLSEENIKILNTSTEELSIIPAGDRAFAVAWSADGDWVASDGDRGIQIWERQTGQLVRETEFKLPGYGDIVHHMSFSADKKLLAAGSDYGISIWNTTTGALTWTIDCSNVSHIESVSFSPDSKRIVSASFAQTIQVWDFSIVNEAAYHDLGYRYGLRFSDKDHFIGQYPDSSLRMWGDTGGPSTFHGLWPTAMAISQDKKRLASSNRGVITIWDVENVKIILKICCRAGHVLYNERDPQVDESQRTNHDIADLECTQCEPDFLGMSEGFHGMAFRDNCELATGFHGLIKIWSIFDGSSVQILDSGTNFVPDMTFSSNSRLLACIAQNIKPMQKQCGGFSASGYQDSTTGDDPNRPSGDFIQIWDTATEQCTSISLPDTTITRGYFVQSLSFSADMQLIAAAGGSSRSINPSVRGIGVWDVKSGSLLRFFKSERLIDITARFDTRIARRLHTEYGFIDVTRYLDETNTSLGCADSDVSKKDLKEVLDAGTQEAMPSFSGYGLTFNRQWIVRDGKRLLWIPPDFRTGYCKGQGLTPVIDGLSIAWLRQGRSPVRLYFID